MPKLRPPALSLKYLRKARLTFGGSGSYTINPSSRVERDEMKIGFSVSKGISGSPNTARLQVWNLAASTRNSVGKELDEVKFEAGYVPPTGGGNVGLIFAGQVRDVEHTRDGTDIITSIDCGDGDKALRRATISKAFPEGTPVEDVIEEVQKQLEAEGIERGEWVLPDDMPPFRRPYVACQSCAREMDQLGESRGFYWSIQSGKSEIIPGDGAQSRVILVSATTGMQVPTITDNGVRVRTLLDPEIQPNRRVRVESQVLEMNGEGSEYRVSQATFSGDNREGDFVVDIHGEAIRGGKVDQGVRP